MIAHDFSSFLPLILILLVAAASAGFLAGLFGIGGGAIFVPVLYQTFEALGISHEVTMHLAIGTSLGIIVPTSLRSLASHWKRDAVDWRLLKEWTIAVPLGAVVGALVAASISSEALRATFAVLAFVLGLKMLLGRTELSLGKDLPGLAGRSVAGFVIGILSSLMGIGGGVLNNTFMTLYGRSMIQAVATSAGIGVLISIPGLFSYIVGGWNDPLLPVWSLGFVNLAALLTVAPASILVVPLGAALAHRLTRRQMEIGFGLFLLTAAARFTYSLF